jgi:hypothetical protein
MELHWTQVVAEAEPLYAMQFEMIAFIAQLVALERNIPD